MPWNCRMIESPERGEYGGVPTSGLEVGDMFFWPDYPADHLSARYHRENAWRAPLMVMLPDLSRRAEVDKFAFCVDSKCYDGARGYYDGWRVTGRPPGITVEPSINCVGWYHGYLRGGIITDDVEGRGRQAMGTQAPVQSVTQQNPAPVIQSARRVAIVPHSARELVLRLRRGR